MDRLAAASGPVLIIGASGTGKEVVARELHARGARRSEPFVAVNCAAFPENLIDSELFGHERGAFTGADASHRGLFEAAHRGVLFLDEIGDVPPSTQVRLLRALQEGEIRSVGSTRARRVDVRVVAATNVDLQLAMAEGRFRQDLFFRLSTFRVELPALRDRCDDVILLAQHFVRSATNPPRRLAPRVIDALRAYWWPGNVRELKNAIEYAVTVCDGEEIDLIHLPHEILTPAPSAASPKAAPLEDLTYRDARERFEKSYLSSLLATTGWNLSEMARRSGIDRTNLRRMLRRLKILQDRT